MSGRLILIGCSSAKLKQPEAAAEFYTSPLFKKGKDYAEASGMGWQILSAARGLVSPSRELAYYDTTMDDLTSIDQAAWALNVAGRILDMHGDWVQPRSITVELHAGVDYCDQLERVLRAVEIQVLRPTKGLQIGERMHWLDEATRRSKLGLLPVGVPE